MFSGPLYSEPYVEASDYPTLESTGALKIDDASHYVGIIKAVDSSDNKQTITIDAAEAMVKLWSSASATDAEHSVGNFFLSSGNLNMKGYYEGNLDVEGGSFSAGNSIGTAEYSGNVTLSEATGSNTTWLIEIDGNASGQQADLIKANQLTFENSFLTDGTINIVATPTIMKDDEFLVVQTTQDMATGLDTTLNSLLDEETKKMWLFALKDSQHLYLVAQDSLVPEPSTWELLILGFTGLMWYRRKK